MLTHPRAGGWGITFVVYFVPSCIALGLAKDESLAYRMLLMYSTLCDTVATCVWPRVGTCIKVRHYVGMCMYSNPRPSSKACPFPLPVNTESYRTAEAGSPQ